MTTRRTLPALRTGVAIIPMDGAVQLRLGDEEVHVLRTDAPELIRETLEQLDGTRDRQALLARLGPDTARLLDDLLDDLLAELARAGMLSAPGAQLDDVGAYLFSAASGTPDPATALKRARVAVVGHARAAGLMAQVLAEHGIDATPVERARVVDGRALAPDSAVVCVCEQPDLTLLFEVNDAACNAGLPCLFVDLSHGRHATVGPFYVPGDGACYRCLRARLHENTAAYAELLAAERRMLESGNPLPAPGCLPAHRHVVTGVAAGEVVAFFARHRPLRTLNRAITVALEDARMWSEPVFRVPWCSGWVRGWDIATGEPCLVPAFAVYLPYMLERDEPLVGMGLSTGLACAPTLEEAVSKGLCEAIERDAMALVWVRGIAPPRVDAGVVREKVGHLLPPRDEVVVYDLETDLGLPVFFVICTGAGPRGPLVSVGAACHPDAGAALRKAAMEASQDRVYVRLLLDRDPAWQPANDFSNVTDFSLHARLYSHGERLARRGLAFLEGNPGVTASVPEGSRAAGVSELAAALGRQGIAGVAVDLTPPWAVGLGLCVARVVIPGLMPLHGNHTLRYLGHPRLARASICMPRGIVTHDRPLWPYPHPMP